MTYRSGVMKGVLELFPESLNSILTVYGIWYFKCYNNVTYNSQPKQKRRALLSKLLPSPHTCFPLSAQWTTPASMFFHASLLLTPREH